MTEAIGGDGGASAACFKESLERLDEAADDLAESERVLERELGQAILGTVRVAALCLGSPTRMQSPTCIIAVAQHVQTLFELRQRAEDYQREAEEYETALANHLACLPR